METVAWHVGGDVTGEAGGQLERRMTRREGDGRELARGREDEPCSGKLDPAYPHLTNYGQQTSEKAVSLELGSLLVQGSESKV